MCKYCKNQVFKDTYIVSNTDELVMGSQMKKLYYFFMNHINKPFGFYGDNEAYQVLGIQQIDYEEEINQRGILTVRFHLDEETIKSLEKDNQTYINVLKKDITIHRFYEKNLLSIDNRKQVISNFYNNHEVLDLDPIIYNDFKILNGNLHFFSISLCQIVSVLETFHINEKSV